MGYAWKRGVSMVLGQNGSGQNVTDKMVRTICYVDNMVLDKMVADTMVRTKGYGQNVKLTKC